MRFLCSTTKLKKWVIWTSLLVYIRQWFTKYFSFCVLKLKMLFFYYWSNPFSWKNELLSGYNGFRSGQGEGNSLQRILCHAQRWSSLDEHQLECTFTCWQGVIAVRGVQKVGRHETKCQTDGLYWSDFFWT